MSELPLDQIAIDLLSALGAAKVLPSVVEQYPGFSLDDGYAVAHRIRALREARGERAVGRKIGGTNPATYAQSGAKGPMWGFVYDSTVTTMPQGFGRYSLGSFRQPRLEPEVVLHIAVAPEAGMSERDIIACMIRSPSATRSSTAHLRIGRLRRRTRSPRMDCIRRCCLGNGWISLPTEGHGLKSCGRSTSASGIATVRNITASAPMSSGAL